MKKSPGQFEPSPRVTLVSHSPERSEGEAKGLSREAQRCFAALSMTWLSLSVGQELSSSVEPGLMKEIYARLVITRVMHQLIAVIYTWVSCSLRNLSRIVSFLRVYSFTFMYRCITFSCFCLTAFVAAFYNRIDLIRHGNLLAKRIKLLLQH